MIDPDQSKPVSGSDPSGTMSHFDFNWQPLLVVWELTRVCALACRHCRASAQHERDPRELNTQEALRFIDQVVAAEPSLLILTGGDPMERPDLEEIVAYAAGKGLRVALSPSATPKFVKSDLERLKQLGLMRISLSLDGSTRESHDKFRGIRGTWGWTMASLEHAKSAGMEFQINTTFTRQNIGEFDAFVALLAELKPVLWSVFLLVPTGRAKRDDLLDGAELENLFERLYQLSRTAPHEIKTTEGHHYRRVVLQHRAAPALGSRAPLGINDGKGFVFVSHTGEICPGGFLPIVAGNVRENELLDVYRNGRIFRQLRDPGLLKGKCGYCDFNSICGGSRARAYAMTGDFLAEEPLCIYQPNRPANRGAEQWRMYCDD